MSVGAAKSEEVSERSKAESHRLASKGKSSPSHVLVYA